MPRDRQLVGACPAIASATASELLARIDDEAGAALAALRETPEKVLGAPELVEAPAFLAGFPFALNIRVSRLYCLPDFIVDDSQLGHVLRDPLRRRIRAGDTLAGVWILQEPLPIPHQTTDVQLVVKNANASLRISVNRARAPERSTGAAHTLSAQCCSTESAGTTTAGMPAKPSQSSPSTLSSGSRGPRLRRRGRRETSRTFAHRDGHRLESARRLLEPDSVRPSPRPR
jgi:hypothetical protein